jgi:hypothetical protein
MEMNSKSETLANWVPLTTRSRVADSICSNEKTSLPKNLGGLVAEIS